MTFRKKAIFGGLGALVLASFGVLTCKSPTISQIPRELPRLETTVAEAVPLKVNQLERKELTIQKQKETPREPEYLSLSEDLASDVDYCFNSFNGNVDIEIISQSILRLLEKKKINNIFLEMGNNEEFGSYSSEDFLKSPIEDFEKLDYLFGEEHLVLSNGSSLYGLSIERDYHQSISIENEEEIIESESFVNPKIKKEFGKTESYVFELVSGKDAFGFPDLVSCDSFKVYFERDKQGEIKINAHASINDEIEEPISKIDIEAFNNQNSFGQRRIKIDPYGVIIEDLTTRHVLFPAEITREEYSNLLPGELIESDSFFRDYPPNSAIKPIKNNSHLYFTRTLADLLFN